MKWKCPKCKKEFARKDQPHFCGKPQNVDEYIEAQDETLRPKLQEIRSIIQKALPEAKECISWSMPTYRKDRNIIHFAASKKHLGLYPGGEATTVFSDELSDYDVSKGTIRFPYDKKLPAKLITRIAKWCYEQYGR